MIAIGSPRRPIAKQLEALTALLGRPIRATVIDRAEWVARHDKRESTVLRLRAGHKLWLRGDGAALYGLERDVRSSRDLLKRVLATRLDLTDDWDEGYDPTKQPLAFIGEARPRQARARRRRGR